MPASSDTSDEFYDSPRNDQRPLEQLICAALNQEEPEAAERALFALRYRGTQEVFERSAGLCESTDIAERTLGVQILAQLGVPQRAFPEQTSELFVRMLTIEQESEVLASIGWGFGHLGTSSASNALCRLKDHPAAEVRFGVVGGLLGEESDLAICALIELSKDPDDEVRDWATFGLGTQIDIDTEQIRDALFARIDDQHCDTRAEAILGLARRHDLRVVPALVKQLSSESVGTLDVEAAVELGSRELCEPLRKLQDWWNLDDEMLKTALERCCERSR